MGPACLDRRGVREVDADGHVDDAEEGEVGRLAHEPGDEIVRDDEAAARGEGRVEGVRPLLVRHERPARAELGWGLGRGPSWGGGWGEG